MARPLRLPELESWLAAKGRTVRAQLQDREGPRSTGSLERKLAELRAMLHRRRRSFANQERMQRLLLLAQLHLNQDANEHAYGRTIRAWLIERDGCAPSPRTITDSLGTSSLAA